MYREEQLRSLLEGRRVLIAGYGREGRSAEALMQRLLPGAPVTVADGNDNIAGESKKPYDIIIKSPGVPMRVIVPEAHDRVSSLTDLFLQVYGDMTVGITGTKGKSTTASLVHHLLPGSLLAGNIGIPLFDILDELHEGSLVVAELSCHQLEVLHRSPHVAVLLNLFQEHLDHYDNYMGYKMAKMQEALHQTAGDHLFYCTDNEELRTLVEHLSPALRGEQHPYSMHSLADDERRLLETCPLAGEHNRSNALVACRVAALVSGKPLGKFSQRLSTFHGLHHRLEPLGRHVDIEWYDDSISTIPAATMSALQALPHVDTLILGGFDRGIDYSPLVGYLTEHPVKNLVFVGVAGRRMLSLFHDIQSNYLVEDDYTRIVPWCAQATHRGGTVLLSPAAASYDAFKNFEHRGDFFRDQIMLLQ